MTRNGFTLVELMVALLIFGMLSAAGVALLSFGVRAQAAADTQLDALAELRRSGSLLTLDLAQAAPRVWRDETGAPQRAFQGATDGFTFVRRGAVPLDGGSRPSLQRIQYRLGPEGLERLAFAHVDGGGAAETSLLLEGARNLRLRYRDLEGNWRDRWDPTRADLLPRAVELVAETPREGAVLQLFLVGGEG